MSLTNLVFLQGNITGDIYYNLIQTRGKSLQRAVVGISHRMLSVTLRKLERDGLVLRTAYPEVPPRVEYSLTPLGVSFIEPAMGVVQWALGADEEIRENRAEFARA